jgi:mannobiose 2-epimerase
MSKCVNLRAEAQALLETNILRFWSERMVDTEHGGFYGRIDGHDILHPEAEKGAVLNARILWTFAGATRILHRMPHRILAARAKDYLLTRFIDPQYGGVYWSLNADGSPLDTKKQTYAIAFAIYGLAEYYRATQDQEALDAAIRLFEDIEAHAFDAVNVGYIEALTRDWQPIADMRLSESDENGSRTMNTHLHVLEAYTNLYRVYKDPRVARQLRFLIDIFVNRLFNPSNGHLDLFFDDQWQGRRDKTSPGHDIEAAWLLREALEVLGDQELLQQTLPICSSLAQAAEEGILSESQWWCYAEAVVGYIDQWQVLLEKEPLQASINYELAEAAYDFIQTHLLDREHGEWFWSILPDGTPNRNEDKAGFWKCPYHNSRMCYELIERL